MFITDLDDDVLSCILLKMSPQDITRLLATSKLFGGQLKAILDDSFWINYLKINSSDYAEFLSLLSPQEYSEHAVILKELIAAVKINQHHQVFKKHIKELAQQQLNELFDGYRPVMSVVDNEQRWETVTEVVTHKYKYPPQDSQLPSQEGRDYTLMALLRMTDHPNEEEAKFYRRMEAMNIAKLYPLAKPSTVGRDRRWVYLLCDEACMQRIACDRLRQQFQSQVKPTQSI